MKRKYSCKYSSLLISISAGTIIPCLAVSACGVNLASPNSLSDFNISSDGKTLVRLGPGRHQLTEFDIPNTIEVIDDNVFSQCIYLKSITIPASVKKIGKLAFFGCFNLEKVTFAPGSQLESIGDFAFGFCSNLKEFEIPPSVTSIGFIPFNNCHLSMNIINHSSVLFNWWIRHHGYDEKTAPLEVDDPQTIYNQSEVDLSKIKNSDGKPITIIGDGVFQYSPNLTSITLNEGISAIGKSAFNTCQKLTQIVIPKSVVSIGEGAFTSTDTGIAPEGVFQNCVSLKSVTFVPGSQLRNITDRIFYGCYALSEINNFPETISTIGNDAFNKCQLLTNIVIPQGLTTIGNNAFQDCIALKEIVIPQGITSINENTFKNCLALQSISFAPGSKLVSIGNNAFNGCKVLINIKIPDSVTIIGDYAFSDCTEMKDINIPNSATQIGKFTFVNCQALTNVEIPSSVTLIDDSAFRNCLALNKINIPDNTVIIGAYAFKGCSNLSTVTISAQAKLETISSEVFSDCKSLKNIGTQDASTSLWSNTWPNSLTNIGSGAFTNCVALEKIEISDNVTSIGSGAFQNCSSLTSVIFNKVKGSNGKIKDPQLQHIDANTFQGCTKLADIEIPYSVTSIQDNAFSNCSSLTTLTIPNSVKSIGSGAFSGTKLTNDFTNNSTVLFNEWVQLHEYTLPGGSKKTLNQMSVIDLNNLRNSAGQPFTSISVNAFKGCNNLKKIIIPKSISSINKNAFSDCTQLEEVEILGDIPKLDAEVFKGCSSLKTITIPASVASIGESTFENCSALTTVNLPSSVASIGLNAFKGSGLKSIIIPSSVVNLASGAFSNCLSLSTVTFDHNEKIKIIENNLFNNCQSLTNINLPNSVETIADGAFNGCQSLTNIIIPKNVFRIEMHAFQNCTSLQTINIPAKVFLIDDFTFSGCSSLESLTFSDNSSLNTIGKNAFSGCALVNVTLPNQTKSINSYAFQDCAKLISITLPASIKEIVIFAFKGCSPTAKYYVPDADIRYFLLQSLSDINSNQVIMQ